MNRLIFATLMKAWFYCLMICSFLGAQTNHHVDFDLKEWEIKAEVHEFTDFKGKSSLYLKNGKAHLKNAQFKNGIIDFDIHFSEGRKFLGVHFRVEDLFNYEEFYLRPHQSGNPDAMQYTPVFNGNSGWQLYHGAGYSNAYNFNFNEWNHVRLVVRDAQAEIFINDMTSPILKVHDLKRSPQIGSVGFWTLRDGAYFANLKYENIEQPIFLGSVSPVPTMEKNVIQNWQVSSALPGADLKGITDLAEFLDVHSLEWTKLSIEYSGIINLGRVTSVTDNSNMILVKLDIQSDVEQLKKLTFGYSDEATMFVNNHIVYSGQNKFRSRDYRYLGTIGYFDSVYLTLKKGKNQVIFAITETMGGWGIKAKLEDVKGLSLP